MESFARYVKVTLPNYLRSLPIPSTLEGFTKLDGKEWAKLCPFLVLVVMLVYLVISALLPSKKQSDSASSKQVNLTIEKDKPKVANVVEIESLGDKTAFCRCWKSKKFPYCDGSHGEHNKLTGDNVGPVVLKRKAS